MHRILNSRSGRRTHASVSAAFLAALFAVAAGCSSSPDIQAWQAAAAKPRPPAERAGLEADLAKIEVLRNSLHLEASRGLALALAAERPGDPGVLHLASRAESDQLAMLAGAATGDRDLAALSALDYAERAATAGAASADSLAQLAWALGTTTHLKSMFSRAGHAQLTLETIERALALDAEQPRALATLSILRLRLATLPWIARAMAWGAPAGSIEEAVAAGEKCVAREPSLENRLILARALAAADRKEEAASLLEQAVAAPDAFARDRVIRPQARELLAELKGEELVKRPPEPSAPSPALSPFYDHRSAPLTAVDEGPLRGLRHRTVIDRTTGAASLALWQEEHLPGFRVPVHRHDCEEVIAVIAGAIRAAVGGAVHEVRGGQSILIPAWALHGFEVVSPEPVRLLALFAASDPRIFRADGTPSEPPWRGGASSHLEEEPGTSP